MKYQNLKSFEKHLEAAAPHHLCHCYLIVVADDQERMNLIQTLQNYLLSPEAPFHRFTGANLELRDFIDAVQSPSLFGGESVVFLDECEKLGKKDTETLSEWLKTSNLSSYLLFGSRGKTQLAKIVEKTGVVFDMSEEKPWDREKRLAEMLLDRAKSRGKRLSSDAALLLFERIGLDGALLEQEIDKLICYVGDRPVIERSDIFRISASSRSHTLWQIAEEIVWEGGKTLDPKTLHGLIPALRYQLILGLKIATLCEEQTPVTEWTSHLPRMRPRTLEKRKEQVVQRGASFFKRGLDLLFKIELLSRTGSNQMQALLDLFQVSLHVYAR